MSDHTTTIFGSEQNLQSLHNLHLELLNSIGEYPKLDRFRGQEWTTFMPRRGLHATDSSLMIVGRAVNGWRDPISLELIATPEGRADVLKKLLEEFQGDKCPMAWVETPQEWNWKRSSFSRLMHQLTATLPSQEDTPWPSRLIWSNLYKIAPYNGGNPSNRLCYAQDEVCWRYFAKELEIWQPKRVVVVTGWSWAKPFVEHLFKHRDPGAMAQPEPKQLVEWSGLIRLPSGGPAIPLVVCKRPEYRPVAKLVEEITNAFQSLAPVG